MKRLILVLSFALALMFLANQDATPPEPSPTPIDLQNHSGRYLMVFQADWCQPCHYYESTLIEAEKRGVVIKRIDYDDNPDLVRKYNIKVVPTTLVMEDENEMERQEGNITIAALFKLLGDTLKMFLPKLLNILFMV